jgi:hypothetical protein
MSHHAKQRLPLRAKASANPYNGGQESACGWCKDRWGLSWQIIPRVLTETMADPDRAPATGLRGDDDHEEDRRCRNRSGVAWSGAEIKCEARRYAGFCASGLPRM